MIAVRIMSFRAPTSFRAAVLEELGRPLRVREDLEIPALKAGQVLVQIAFSGVCHSQLMEVRGRRGTDPYVPHLLGHEATGVVRAAGSEVTKVSPGDRVILSWIRGSGLDAGGCVYSRADGTRVNAGGVTTFSEYSVVSENRCVKLPSNLPLDVGVLLGCAIPTGAGMVVNTLGPTEESTLLIVGAGGIGLSALLAATRLGCKYRIVVDVSQEKLDLAKSLGATHIFLSGRTEADIQAVNAKVRELTLGKGVDYAVDAAGRTRTIEQAFECIRRGGRAVFASHPEAGSKISIDPFEMINGKRLEGSWGGQSRPDRDFPIWSEWYASGKFPMDRLLTQRYALKEVNEALDDLEAGRVGRPLLEINPDL